MSEPLLIQKTLQGQQDGPHLLILGGVHGDEFESMAAIRRLIRQLQPQTLRGRVTFVPVVNEAAFWRGHRTAEDGLDLARSCPGKANGSITQRVAHAVSELIRTADYFIDLHSGGIVMQVWPLVGYMLHPDAEVLQTQRRMARAFNLPVIWGTTSKLNGRTLSVARDAKVPGIYAEWRGAGLCDPQGVQAYVEGCLNVMGELGMIQRDPPPSRVQHVVEDGRDQSGHMQVNYPAPAAGFFEPAVELGQRVSKGDRLGLITDHLGQFEQEILSTQNGLVLCLRSFSRVLQGDCLAVILETAASPKETGS